jgi:tetratricopeptide (TPR) repeat protein
LVPRLNNLAVMLYQQDQFAEAEPLQREALARELEARGPHDPLTLTAANNLGMLLLQRGDFIEAARVFDEAAQESLSGGEPSRPLRAILLHHQAEALRLMDRLDEARPRAVEAVELYQHHPEWSQTEAHHAVTVLASLHATQGETEALLALLEPRIERARRASPRDEAGIAAVEITLGANLIELGEYSRAEAALRECAEIRGRLFPEGDPGRWRYFYAVSLLGGALTGQAADEGTTLETRLEKLREAEPLLVSSCEWLRDDPRVPLPPLMVQRRDVKKDSFQRVIDLYEAWHALEPEKGHDQAAARWRAEAAAAPSR